MPCLHSVLSGALLIGLLALAGCRSVLNLPPAQDIHGGFAVAVGLPGQPTAGRVFADVETFARQRGFVRQDEAAGSAAIDPATRQAVPPPAHLRSDKMALDVAYEPAHLRVVADLHSPGALHDRRFMQNFTRDFRQQYGASYGDEGSIVANNQN